MRAGKDFHFSTKQCVQLRIFVSLLTCACGEGFSFLYQAVRAGKDFRFSSNLCVQGRIFVSLLTCACREDFRFSTNLGENGGLVVNASDSGSRGRGLEPHSGQTVLCP